ncbi:MAG: 3TM-type holin [Xanthobacteraceae bacterium]
MDWSDLAKTVIGLGAPLIGQALGGPLGAAAGKILAAALGASEPTPAAVQEAIEGSDPSAAVEAAARAEAEWAEALAQIGKAQVEQVSLTQRAEIASGDLLQRWWRPIYALELSLIECPAFALTLLHALWVGHQAGIIGFANLSSLLMAYFAARFGVLGVYVSGRSREKQCLATGEPVPGIVERAVRAVRERR